MDKFKGKEDPREHLRYFKYSCYIIANDEIIMLRIFHMNLVGQALDLYNNLLQHSIFSFEQLANQFLDHFGINIIKRDSIMDLSKLSQFDDKSISSYSLGVVISTTLLFCKFKGTLPLKMPYLKKRSLKR